MVTNLYYSSILFYWISWFVTVSPGVGIGIVDLGYERRLASQLGAHRAPSIIGLLNGRVTFFHQAVVREHLRQFVEDLLPHKLVEKVNVSDLNIIARYFFIQLEVIELILRTRNNSDFLFFLMKMIQNVSLFKYGCSV